MLSYAGSPNLPINNSAIGAIITFNDALACLEVYMSSFSIAKPTQS